MSAKVTIPNTEIVEGSDYSIPVLISDLPANTCAFEIIVQTEEQLFEMKGVDPVGSMIEGKMYFSNNGVQVPGWISPYSKGKMIVVAADAYPFQGETMLKIVGIAKKTGKVAINSIYLCLGAEIYYGIRPSLVKVQ